MSGGLHLPGAGAIPFSAGGGMQEGVAALTKLARIAMRVEAGIVGLFPTDEQVAMQADGQPIAPNHENWAMLMSQGFNISMSIAGSLERIAVALETEAVAAQQLATHMADEDEDEPEDAESTDADDVDPAL